MSLVIVGSVAFDTIRTPWGDREKIVGGSGTYCSLAASYFTRPRIVGVVGRDFPRKTLALLRSRGVDLAGLKVKAGKTFHWEGKYEDDPNRRTTLRTELNVFADFRPEGARVVPRLAHRLSGQPQPGAPRVRPEAVPQAGPGRHGHDPALDRYEAGGPAQGARPGRYLLRQRRGGPADHRGDEPHQRRQGPGRAGPVARPAQEGRARRARLRARFRLRRPGPPVRARHRPDRGGGQLRRGLPGLSRQDAEPQPAGTSTARRSTAASWPRSPSRISGSGGSCRSTGTSSKPGSGSSAR